MNTLAKKLMWLAILLASPALFAQNIVGTWQGTFEPPQATQGLRIVVKILRADDESLKAVMYSIDQGAQPINASAVSLQGSALKMTVVGIGGNYEGKWSGNTITGMWSQGGPPLPLNLIRATPETAWVIPEPPPPPKPMAGDDPSFEVATIKPSNPDTPGQSILVGRGGGNLFTTTNTPLRDLIIFAYGIHPRQLQNAPGWTETEKYDITGKPDRAGVPNDRQVRAMVQKLLAERFQLSFHRENKDLPAFVMTVAKGGPKLAKNESGGLLPGFGGRGPGSIGVRNTSMREFAGFLQARILDRPVVDQTGLTEKYDFTLTWRPDQLPPQGPNAPPLPSDLESRSDLFTAMQEQLGLKIEPSRAQVEVLVIDRVKTPSEN